MDQRCDTSRSMTISEKESGSTGPLRPPAGTGPNFADATNRRWVAGSSPMFRDPGAVCRFWTT